MTIFKKIMICCVVVIGFSGCAYRHYLGIHGPSMKAFPDIHQGLTEDQDCRGCHDPGQNPTGPPSSHPLFTGCLKCHNDDIN